MSSQTSWYSILKTGLARPWTGCCAVAQASRCQAAVSGQPTICLSMIDRAALCDCRSSDFGFRDQTFA